MDKQAILEKLDTARKKLAEAQSEREASREERALLVEIEQTEQRAKDLAEISRAEAEHGADNVASIDTDLGAVIVKRPNSAAYRYYIDLPEKIRTTMIEIEKFVTPHVIYPTPVRWSEMIEQRPGIITDAATAAFQLCGAKAAAQEKK